jgi:hypothetical protein
VLGGGIFNNGVLTLSGTSLAQNTASASSGTAQGGGLYNQNFGAATLTNSVVTLNAASGATAQGGGIYNNGGAVTLSKTRVKKNLPDNCEPTGTIAHCSG